MCVETEDGILNYSYIQTHANLLCDLPPVVTYNSTVNNPVTSVTYKLHIIIILT